MYWKAGNHVSEPKRMVGTDRRKLIIQHLKQSEYAVTGTDLAELTGVSRQVIVQDVSLLKAMNEPIIATSRGYMYLQEKQEEALHRRVIVCNHTPENTQEELEILVDCGVTVVDVIVEHPFYGGLTGSLMISSRFDVEQFVKAFTSQEAGLLLVLTGGIHLHTIEADSEEKLDAACKLLDSAGILVTDQ